MNPNADTTKEFIHAFTLDDLASAPDGFTDVGTNNIYVVSNDVAWYGDRCLKVTGGGSINHNFTYVTPTNLANGDYEVKGLFRFDDFAGDRFGIMFRCWNDSGTHKGYGAFMYGGNSVRVSSFSGTTESTKNTTASGISYATDTWYWIKVLTSGTSIKVKIWAINSNEPATWLIDITSSDIDNTHTGIGVYGRIGNANDAYADYLRAYKKPALPDTTPSNDTEKRVNVWHTYKETFIRFDGAVVRPDPDRDVVSEAPAYALKLAVQMNDQTTFDLVENFCYNTMRRGANSEITAVTLMGWLIDLETHGTNIADTNWATDGDIDRAVALFWAHARWGSAGTINYKARALAILDDIRTYSANTDNSMAFILPYDGLVGDASYRINPSYLDPSAFRLFAYYDTANTTFWNQAVDGTYFIIEESTDNAGSLATTAGLPTEWLIYNSSTNEVESSTGDDEYGFNAFRVLYRLYWDYIFYGSTEASTWLAGAIADFFHSEYDTNGDIDATYDHDGTNPSGYDLEYFYWASYYALLVGSKATASTVLSTELANAYSDDGVDAQYFDTGYYPSFWNFIAQLRADGELTNYLATDTNIVQGMIASS